METGPRTSDECDEKYFTAHIIKLGSTVPISDSRAADKNTSVRLKKV